MQTNRYTSLVLAGILTIIFLCAVLPRQAAAGHELVIAVDTALEPFSFERRGKYIGFDLDLWAAIARDAGFTYRFEPMPFGNVMPALQHHGIDAAMAGITINDTRKKSISFSDPYYDSGLAVIVGAESKILHMQDLDGKRIGVKAGTISMEWAQTNLKSSHLSEFKRAGDAYIALRTGTVDAVINDSPGAMYYVKTSGGGEVRVLAQRRVDHSYGIAFSKDSTLIGPVNAALKRIKADGRYNAIHQKWFGIVPHRGRQKFLHERSAPALEG